MKQAGLDLQISAAVVPQHGDKMLCEIQRSKDRRCKGKKPTFTFLTWRSKTNMGRFPRSRACCGVDVQLQRVRRVVFAETCHSVRSEAAAMLPGCADCTEHARVICPKLAEYLTFFERFMVKNKMREAVFCCLVSFVLLTFQPQTEYL